MVSFLKVSSLVVLAASLQSVVATPPACLIACVAQVEKASSCSGLNDISCVCSSEGSAVEQCLNSICPNGDASTAISAFESSCQGYSLNLSSSSSSSSSSSTTSSSSSTEETTSSSSTEETTTSSSSTEETTTSTTSVEPSSTSLAAVSTVESTTSSSTEAPATTSSLATSTTSSAAPSSTAAITTQTGAADAKQLSFAALAGLVGFAFL